MSAGDRQLSLAAWLLGAGAGQSARNVLGATRGAAANRLRLAAREVSLRPGVYCLVSMPDGTGAVLPLRPSPGHPRAADRTFREACLTAHELTRRLFDERALPMLRFDFEEELSVLGPSIGLPAALAFAAHLCPSRAPSTAVLATGRLHADGRVESVGHLDAKHAIALREQGDKVILFPPAATPRPGVHHVSTFAEAARAAFGGEPLSLDPALFSVDALVRRARTAADARDGVALLEALDVEALAPADRVRVLFDLGTLRRYLGDSGAAWDLHTRARGLLDAERLTLGSEAAERFELEHWASALDRFELEMAVRELRERLARPFLKVRNELRCRGMLAQGLAMEGRFAEAVRVREENLGLHELSEALRKTLPATLCHLALDSALAGDAAGFERHARSLGCATSAGNEVQWRFNGAVMVRGLVALGRFEAALQWARDEVRLYDCRPPATLVLAASGAAAEVRPPEISALRASCARCGGWGARRRRRPRARTPSTRGSTSTGCSAGCWSSCTWRRRWPTRTRATSRWPKQR